MGEVITLEDWALIRRLHLSERVPKAQIARDLGVSRTTVAKGGRVVEPAAVLPARGGDEFRAVRAAGPGAAGGDAVDAGDGAGRAGRLDGVGDLVPAERGTGPAGLRADRSGRPDRVSPR